MGLLTTIDKVKEFIVQDTDRDDVRITSCLTRASAIIERYCKRTFLQTNYIEFYTGNDTEILQLRNFPIIGTPTVLENGGALTVGTDPSIGFNILVDAQVGRLIRPFASWLNYWNYYKVTYDAGYATVPDEIAEAAIEMTLIMLKEKERAGMAQHTTGAVTSAYIRKLPEFSQQSLDLQRDFVLGRVA